MLKIPNEDKPHVKNVDEWPHIPFTIYWGGGKPPPKTPPPPRRRKTTHATLPYIVQRATSSEL